MKMWVQDEEIIQICQNAVYSMPKRNKWLIIERGGHRTRYLNVY